MKFSCSCKCFRFIRIFICCHLLIFRRQVFSLFASNSSPITVRLGLVSDNIHFQYLQAQFNSLLVKYNSQYDVLPLFKIEGTTVCWNRGEPPSNRLKNLNRQLVLQNISAVLSLLPPNENELLASFLHGLSIPVLGSGSKEEQWYLRGKVSRLIVRLLQRPSQLISSDMVHGWGDSLALSALGGVSFSFFFN